MRGIDLQMKTALAQRVVRPALFVHLGFATPANLWSGKRSIVANGRTYAPSRGLIGISEIAETLDGAQQQATVTVENISSADAIAPSSAASTGIVVTTVNYTGADVIITAPEGAYEYIMHAWGASGGPDGYVGGVGGYTRIHASTEEGSKYTAKIGQGGINLTTVYGFGGTGQGAAHQHNGGGGTYLFEGDSVPTSSDFTRLLAAAGGGGAGGWNGSSGRAGGNGNDTVSGGSTTMQGAAATGGVSTGQGGGGGGYKGGAYTGRAGENLYGVGGSGYGVDDLSAPLVLGAAYPSQAVPESTNKYYDGLAGKNAQNGLMVIEWLVEVAAEEEDVACEVHLGTLDTDWHLDGVPQLIFSGTVDAIGWDFGPDQINATVEIIGAPPIVEATTGQRYTDRGQQKKYSGDLGLAFVASLQTKTLTWGST